MSSMARMLEQTVTRILLDHCSPEVIAQAETGEWPVELWRALEEAGLTTLLVPEEAGGGGGTHTDAGIVLRLAGAFSAPAPIAETLLASEWLAAAGIAVPDGPLTIVPVQPDVDITLQRTAEGWLLNGEAQRIAWAGLATGVVVVMEHAGQPLVLLIRPTQESISPGSNLAGEPMDTIHLVDVTVADSEAGKPPAGWDAERLFAQAALVRCVQMSGALQQVLELAIEYSQQRVQFRHPIGHFQVIQQYLVQLAGHVAAARTAADLAIALVDSGDADFAIAAAKTRIGASVRPATEIAHQVHGALGFTQEHRLQLSTRRLWSWRDEYGSEAYWAARLGRRTLQAGTEDFWPLLAASHRMAPEIH